MRAAIRLYGDPDAPSVSAQAQAALLAKYPAASNVRWQTKGGYVVADFSLAGTRVGAQHGGSDLSAWFDNGGEWYMTQTDIPFTMLPEAVRTAFAATEYAAAPWSVDDVDMLEREGVETVYVIEVEKYDNGRETEIDLYYSVDGVLVRKIADAAPDYDYGDYIPVETRNGYRGIYSHALSERPHHGYRLRKGHDRGGYRRRSYAA